MRWLVIKDGVVVNVVRWDGETPWEPPVGCTVASAPDHVGVGWLVVDGQIVPPPALELWETEVLDPEMES